MSDEKACMGGWCRIRERCQHYGARDGAEPAERLCEPGRDGVLAAAPAADTTTLKPACPYCRRPECGGARALANCKAWTMGARA